MEVALFPVLGTPVQVIYAAANLNGGTDKWQGCELLSHDQCNIRLEKGGRSLCGSPIGIGSYCNPIFMG